MLSKGSIARRGAHGHLGSKNFSTCRVGNGEIGPKGTPAGRAERSLRGETIRRGREEKRKNKTKANPVVGGGTGRPKWFRKKNVMTQIEKAFRLTPTYGGEDQLRGPEGQLGSVIDPTYWRGVGRRHMLVYPDPVFISLPGGFGQEKNRAAQLVSERGAEQDGARRALEDFLFDPSGRLYLRKKTPSCNTRGRTRLAAVLRGFAKPYSGKKSRPLGQDNEAGWPASCAGDALRHGCYGLISGGEVCLHKRGRKTWGKNYPLNEQSAGASNVRPQNRIGGSLRWGVKGPSTADNFSIRARRFGASIGEVGDVRGAGG